MSLCPFVILPSHFFPGKSQATTDLSIFHILTGYLFLSLSIIERRELISDFICEFVCLYLFSSISFALDVLKLSY